MLNRLYIIIGTLTILVLGGAFVVPRFVQWSDYRVRMEALASGVVGAPVMIRGDIEFSLLPQPRLSFSDVVVGAPDAPAATIGAVTAEFPLFDFLRDNYRVTNLVLERPVFDLAVDESGLLGSGLDFGGNGQGSVSLQQASIIDGTIRLADQRVGETFSASDIDGELGLDSFTGPYQFQGNASVNGGRYGIRVNTSGVDADGFSRLTASVNGVDHRVSLTAEGQLKPGIAPKFNGKLGLRLEPLAADATEQVRGDLVLEAQIAASTDRVVLSSYELRPDVNRAGMRLTGAASIQLGARRSFDAVISGGVFSLPPRNANEDATMLPYEVVRMLGELPAPLIPPLPGRIGVDMAEMGLRGFALRNVRMDASTDGKVWQIEQFSGQLPGDAQVRASGVLSADGGRPGFNGQASITTLRLDALARLWRKPAKSNPLFNMPGSIKAKVMLAGDALGLSQGVLMLDGEAHAVELRIGFGDEKRLDVVGHFGSLNAADSAAMGALLPNIMTDASFPISFPSGSFALSAKSAMLLGQTGTGLAAEGQWGNGQLSFTQLSARDFGGLGLDAALQLAGTFAEPRVSGSGRLTIGEEDGSALLALYDLGKVPAAWRTYMGLSLPGEVIFDLGALDKEKGQTLTLVGTLGSAHVDVTAQMAEGIGQALNGQLKLNGTLEAADPAALTRQLGFGDAELFMDPGSMMVALNMQGSPSNSLAGQITASVGEESLNFSGTLLAANGELQGIGALNGITLNGGGLAQLVGLDGLRLPIDNVTADLDFEGARTVRLTQIDGRAGASGFSGELSLSRSGATAIIAGNMTIDEMDIRGLAGGVMGAAALLPGAGIWPEGPITTGAEPRLTRGSVAVTVPLVMAGGVEKLHDARFDLAWDETKVRLARFAAGIGAGALSGDFSVCCAGPLPARTINGRLRLSGVNLDDMAPLAVSEALDGTLDGGVSIQGTGASIASLQSVLTGEGNFTVHDLKVHQLDPNVFSTVAKLPDVLHTDADALGAIMGLALGQGDFTAPIATGTFTIAGGVVRLSNLLIKGQEAQLNGDVNLTLKTLGLDGNFVLSPAGFTDPSGLVTADTARIVNSITGTLTAPEIRLDLGPFVSAVQVHANEIEVDRLQALQAEDEARQRAAAEHRNQLIAAQHKAAAEKAARVAAEEAARKAAEDEALQPQPVLPKETDDQAPQQTLDLSLPPASPPFMAPLR